MNIRSLCVFCGSCAGVRPAYAAVAEALGRTLAARRVTLVFGGGKVGLMGVLADAALKAGGAVYGVIPRALAEMGLAHPALTALYTVGSMHERKARMTELSDGFIALPGGIGTMEELFEVWTAGQLGWHAKPCGVLNVEGFFDPLSAFLDHAVAEGFVKGPHRAMLLSEDQVEPLLERFAAYHPPRLAKWDGNSPAIISKS